MAKNASKASAVPLPSQSTVDALSLWGGETVGTSPATLRVIRLDGNERLIIPFTTALQRVQVHYLDFPSLRDFVHCGGAGCLLCRLGRQVETRDLLPVYDAVDKAVGVLSVSPNVRPNALRPQLMSVLQRLKGGGRLLVGLRKQDNTRFVVATYELPEDAEDGADAILKFTEELAAGRVDLGGVFSRLSNADLAAVPEVGALMAVKGVKLS
jgi:hypothetical protein